jgi:murein DD-endopeptidase MepM/ murein hydrolase activator NlpD
MAGNIVWPLTQNSIRGHAVSNTFGMVRHYANGSSKPHQGWDLTASVGTSARAVGDGKVVFVKDQGDYGRQVCLSFTHNNHTYYAFYAHMHTINVVANQAVTKGQIIGTTGKTGNAANLAAREDHLHFETRTQAECGLGLTGRISPLQIFGVCPLNFSVTG